MAELLVSCPLDLPELERGVLLGFLPAATVPAFESDPRRFPRRRWLFMGGGGFGESLLAPLAVTILGGGALILLKAFLESVGSELGKSFVKRWRSRKVGPSEAARSESGFIVLVELRPSLLAVVRLHPLGLESHHTEGLLASVEGLSREVGSEEAVLWAQFDPSSDRWTVVRGASGLGGVVYRGSSGDRFVHE